MGVNYAAASCRRRYPPVASKLGKRAALIGLAAFFMAGQGWAQTDKPRFVILLDNSTSMTQSLAGVQTHGDGSEAQPGCNLDGKSTAGCSAPSRKILTCPAVG